MNYSSATMDILGGLGPQPVKVKSQKYKHHDVFFFLLLFCLICQCKHKFFFSCMSETGAHLQINTYNLTLQGVLKREKKRKRLSTVVTIFTGN